MIYTSYFSSKAPRERKVSIAKWPPRYFAGLRAKLFAPSNPKAEDWEAAYKQDLLTRFPSADILHSYLESIEAEVKNPILCCFEADKNECHRSILAAFIKEQLKRDIEEWESKDAKQGTLL